MSDNQTTPDTPTSELDLHLGIYVGHGKVIHAPHPGRSVEYTGLGGFSKAGRVG